MSDAEDLFAFAGAHKTADYIHLSDNSDKLGSIETLLFVASNSEETKTVLPEFQQSSINSIPENILSYKMMNDYNVFKHASECSSELFLKCPICYNQRKKLFCHNCIKNGDFTHSKKNFLERFADKKLKFIKLKGQQKQLTSIVEKNFCNIILKDDLNLKIRKIDNNCKILQKLISDKKLLLLELESDLDGTKRDQFNSRQKQMNLRTRIKEIKDLLAKQSVAIDNRVLENSKFDSNIRDLLREKLNSLSSYIFPIREELFESLNISGEINDIRVNSETTPLLCSNDSNDDDFKTSQQNHQPKSNRLKLVKFKIVEPWVGLNENYNLFFSQTSRLNYLEIHENNFRNDEYRITSALSYLCHLTNLIAIFCDINLPKKLLFSEFYFKENKKEDFLFKVAKLNVNILFLCIYHHMDTKSINPQQSFKNVQLLLNSPSFTGVLDNHIEICKNVFNSIQDTLISDLSLIGKEAIFEEATTDVQEEHDYDFVESNIPDLNFSSLDQQPSNFLSIFSSLYKRATKN